MQHGSALIEILVLLVAAVLAVPLFHRLRLGPVLGYLAAGVVIGPHVLGLISDVEDAHRLGEFGVVFLLFAIGLELKLSRLLVMRRLVFGLGSLQVLVTGGVLAGVVWAAGVEPVKAVVVGGGLALSSTAVVLQLLMERGELTGRPGRVAFSVLLMQDMAVVPLLVMVSVLAGTGESADKMVALAMGKAFLLGGAIWLAGRFVVPHLLRLLAATGSADVFAAAAVLVVLGTAWVTQLAGLSMALGAFLAGLVLAETEFRHQIEADIQPFRGFLLGLFFMSVGMGLDVGLLGRDLGTILMLLLALMAVKAVVLAVLAACFRLGWDVAVQAGLLLCQGGEFAFVLFGQASAARLMEPAVTSALTLAVSLSMMVTPLVVAASGRVAQLFRPSSREPDGGGRLAEAAGLSGHVVLAGFGRVGQTVAQMLAEHGVPYLALDLEPDRVVAARVEGLPVYYADASRAEVLRAAGAGRARALVITLDQAGAVERAMAASRHHFPALPVFTRARDRDHSRALRGAGAAAAVPETTEASLQLGAMVLRRALEVPPAEVNQLLIRLREQDYRGLGPLLGGASEWTGEERRVSPPPRAPDGGPAPP